MTVRIEIDPNVRVRGNQTYAGFEECSPLVPRAGEEVIAVVSEMNMAGLAKVTDVDYVKGLVYLAVEWSRLRPATMLEPVTFSGDESDKARVVAMRPVDESEDCW